MEILATCVALLFALYYALIFVDILPLGASTTAVTVKIIAKLVLIAVWVYWWLRLAGKV